EDRDFPAYRGQLADLKFALGHSLQRQARHADAAPIFHDTAALYEKRLAESDADERDRFKLQGAYRGLGASRSALGKRDDALAAFRQGLALAEKLVAEFPDTALYQIECADLYLQVGMLVRDQKKLTEARQRLEQAVAHAEAALRRDPINDSYRQTLERYRAEL